MSKVVFLCKGTRGDVHPLLCVALRYRERHRAGSIVFACSPASLTVSRDIIEGAHGVQLRDLPDQQILLASQAGKDKETILKLTDDEERLSLLKSEMAVCLQASQGATLVIFNLFSLEGYFIALHLGIPCVAASPHLPTKSVPSGFEAQLASVHPQLYNKLKTATPGEEVSYAEVDHWMWRLFLDDFGSVCGSLGLPSLPVTLSREGLLPPPTPLLYGISPSVISRQPYWPDSVVVCGYWLTPPCLQPCPEQSLQDLLSSASVPPLYVGFGSMEPYLLDMNWINLFAILEEVLEFHKMEAIFQCREDGPIIQAYSLLPARPKRTHLWPKHLPHLWLFPKCSIILHHGGSGTVATSLVSHKPQIISPVMFDQSMWAEKLSWEGVACQCPSPTRLSGRELSHALKVASGETMRKRVRELGARVSEEDGVEKALTYMEKALREIIK